MEPVIQRKSFLERFTRPFVLAGFWVTVVQLGLLALIYILGPQKSTGIISNDAGIDILFILSYAVLSPFYLISFIFGIINLIHHRYPISSVLMLSCHAIVISSTFINIDNFSTTISEKYPSAFWSVIILYLILFIAVYHIELRKKKVSLVENVTV